MGGGPRWISPVWFISPCEGALVLWFSCMVLEQALGGSVRLLARVAMGAGGFGRVLRWASVLWNRSLWSPLTGERMRRTARPYLVVCSVSGGPGPGRVCPPFVPCAVGPYSRERGLVVLVAGRRSPRDRGEMDSLPEAFKWYGCVVFCVRG